MLKILTSLFAALGLTSCAAPHNKAAVMDLAGSEWAQDIEGQFIRFQSDNRVQGNGGCNRFSGQYSQESGQIRIGPLRSTKMACSRLEQETQFFNALETARSADASHLELVLKDAQGETVLTLRRRDWD